MALHPLKLPKNAAYLFGIVVLQKRLLKALADPELNFSEVNTAWVQKLWRCLDGEWVRKFCLGGQEARIQEIAKASPAAREALYAEFCRQNRVPVLLAAGGDFRDLSILTDFNAELTKAVTDFFKECYALLGQASRTGGYAAPGSRSLTKRIYNEAFRESYPTKIVCPYCDGEIGTAELDHYYSKSHFPLISCSPWNLVPICKSCNDTTVAKGDRLALTPGPPRSATEWLHPFSNPASRAVQIRLTGNPRQSVPELHSPDPAEQRRLNNHVWLMDRLDDDQPYRYLSKRWTTSAAAHFDVLVRRVNKRRGPSNTVQSLVQTQLDDHEDSRGEAASAMVHSAVCRAILEGRPEYLEEFATPNAPGLAPQ